MAQLNKCFLDPTSYADWQIAEAAESTMTPITELGEKWGIKADELRPYERFIGKIDFATTIKRLETRPNGKYIVITAITPTPLGEGKSTTTIGLVDGLGRLGKRASCAIRQPSSGPTFNIKGSASGGGLAQCIPQAPFSLGLTGDIDCVTNAHNLAMVALTSRIQHEFNNTDEFLGKRNLKRLNIDPHRIQLKWVMDFCAQALRDIVIGIGGSTDGFMMRSGFDISVSSEVMAILAIFKDLEDMRQRMGKIIVAYNKQGTPITTRDLEVDGAMTAWMVRASNPNLMQTMEGNPVLVHAGPFANIAVGQSSIVADRLALKLSDYHITESGFGADIGFEKFCNIKTRASGLIPNCAVIVTTVRALKMHGGGPAVIPGKTLSDAYTSPNPALAEKGMDNLLAHIETVKKSGIKPIVCINKFHTDSTQELEIIRRASENAGARVAVSQHWLKGGEGAIELAEAVVDACNEKVDFSYFYDDSTPLRKRIEIIAKEVYGADGVSYSDEALEKAIHLEKDPDTNRMSTCMVKTHLSLSHNPSLKGRPRGWTLPIRDFMTFAGAGLIAPVAGDIKLMPGTSSDPAFRRIDVDTNSARVKGLF